MVHGAWCMVHGAWCMVLGTWCICPDPFFWYMVHGTWCMVHGAGYMVHGAGYMVLGTWCWVHGAFFFLPRPIFVGPKMPRPICAHQKWPAGGGHFGKSAEMHVFFKYIVGQTCKIVKQPNLDDMVPAMESEDWSYRVKILCRIQRLCFYSLGHLDIDK